MNIIRLTKKEMIRHLIVWSIITAFISFIDPITGHFIMKVLVTLLLMLGYMFVYYVEYLFILPMFYGRNTLKLSLYILCCLIIFEVINYFTFYYVMSMFGDVGDFDNAPPYVLALTSLFRFFFVSVVAIGAYQNKMSKLKIQMQDEREKALLIKELGFFKNQFNSHIIFNFLTYCYRYVQKDSREGAEAIELFSNMLKHTLNDNPDEPIELKKEIEYISNFIDLHRQLNKQIQVEFHVEGDMSNQYILPRILITFIENAFKHGEIHSIENPILIRLETFINSIKLNVVNKKKSIKEMIVSTGVGHHNVRQQLELFYKKEYELNINDDGENYSCELLLNTKNRIYA
jgi:two-component system LytT family sensor kinase